MPAFDPSEDAEQLAQWKDAFIREVHAQQSIPRVYVVEVDEMRPLTLHDLTLLGRQGEQFGALWRILKRIRLDTRWDALHVLDDRISSP